MEWAMREAAQHHAALTVLTVNQVAVTFWNTPIILPEDKTAEENARRAAEEAVAKIASQLGDSQPVSVSVRAVSGLPAEEFIKASHDSDQLVLGSRGTGGFARLMLGSVSSQVVEHATCPVTIVPVRR